MSFFKAGTGKLIKEVGRVKCSLKVFGFGEKEEDGKRVAGGGQRSWWRRGSRVFACYSERCPWMLMGMVSRPGSSRRGWGGGGRGQWKGWGPSREGEVDIVLSGPPRGPYLVPLSEDSHPAPFQAQPVEINNACHACHRCLKNILITLTNISSVQQ